MTRRSIEVLVSDGCPNAARALAHAQQAIDALGSEDAVARVVRIERAQDAVALRFLGSPTVRVDGQDVDPTERVNEFEKVVHGI